MEKEQLPALDVRQINDVETLRIVADVTRMAILQVLMTNAEVDPPVMSAKELAAALNEPQTKLYRHLKQLEEAGLIQVAGTRLVSGIVEQRYRAGQVGIRMNPAMLTNPETRSVATDGMVLAINEFRDEMIADIAAARTHIDPGSGSLQIALARVPATRAAELRTRMKAVIAELSDMAAPETVDVHVMVAWYET